MSDLPKAVYSAAEMIELMDCGQNELATLVEQNIIPAPLGPPGSKRRWSAAAVNKKLGLPPPAITEVLNWPLRQLIRTEVDRALKRHDRERAAGEEG